MRRQLLDRQVIVSRDPGLLGKPDRSRGQSLELPRDVGQAPRLGERRIRAWSTAPSVDRSIDGQRHHLCDGRDVGTLAELVQGLVPGALELQALRVLDP